MKTKCLYLLSVAIVCLSCSSNSTKKELNQIDSLQEEIYKTADNITKSFSETEKKYYEGLRSFEENGKFGFVDSLGDIVIKAQYDGVGCFNEGLVSVCLNGKYGFIDKTGAKIIEAKYDYANYFSQGLACVTLNNKFGYIDKKGNIVIDFAYDEASDFWEHDGFAAVKLNGKEGLIDRTGKIIMPIKFEHASSTQNGIAHIFDGLDEYEVYNDGSYKIFSY